MRIDCHVHGDPDKSKDPAGYVKMCRANGIEAVVLIESAERCLRAVERFGDFVIPVARIRMDSDGVSDIERCIAEGCKGIKFIRPAAGYGDERYWPLYAKIEEIGAVAVFHTGYLGFRRREEHPVRIEDMRAAQIDVIARRFPDLKIMMAHFSNPWWEEAWKIAWAHGNVYADLSGGTAFQRSVRFWAETFAPDGVLHEASFAKLCFGSDMGYFDEQAGTVFKRHVDFHDKLFERVNPPADLLEKVCRGNVRALFGLE